LNKFCFDFVHALVLELLKKEIWASSSGHPVYTLQIIQTLQSS